MELQFLADIIVAMHMFCLAAALGISMFVESLIVPRFLQQIERRDVDFLHEGHRLVSMAVLGLWLTGFALIALKLGVMGETLTALLSMKLVIVALLTLNLKMVADHVIPVMRHNTGHHLGVLTRYELRLLGAIAGMSASGWMLALGVGAIRMFETLSGLQLALIFLPLLVAAPALGAYSAPRIVSEARQGPRLAPR